MFKPVVPYSDPWNQPFYQRFSMFMRCRVRIAYFYEAANNSTFRYRAYNMAQVLNEQPEAGVSASYFYLSDYAHFDDIANNADMLVVCRSRYNAQLSHLVAKFRARGKRILFDVDDLVFDTRYVRTMVSTLGLNTYDNAVWDDWFASTSRLGATLQLCDGAITTNPFLAAQITASSGLEARVVPNFLNREQMALSDQLYGEKVQRQFAAPKRITLGYFSGSPSHRLDYAIAESALADIMASDDRVDLLVVGYIDPTGELAQWAHRVHKVPFQDYVNLQAVIASVDFNLMPLQSNVFTDCKSELKFFDAAVVGTLSIASPSFTYRGVIDHGTNGYLAQAHEWTTVIRQAIAAMPRYGEMAETARQLVDERYTWTTQRQTILRALDVS